MLLRRPPRSREVLTMTEQAMADQVRNPLFARLYTRLMRDEKAEQVGYRREMLEGLHGRVIELGAGTGANFDFYPSTVTKVIAVEPEPYLRDQAEAAARHAWVEIEVVDALAGALPFEAESFDAAVVCLVLCTVPDQASALADLHRVLRPGGEMRFYEHVHTDRQPLHTLLEFADRSTIWPRIAGGCHVTRQTDKAIEAAGFKVARCRRFPFSPSPPLPALPHILGVAQRG